MSLFAVLVVGVGLADGWSVRTIALPAAERTDRGPGTSDPIAVSPDGTRVATVAGPTATVWDAATGEPVVRIHLPEADGTALLAFTADGGQLVAAGFRDPAVRWFNLRTGKQEREREWERPAVPRRPTPGLSAPVVSFGPGADWLLASAADDDGPFLRVIDTATGKSRGDVRATAFYGGLPPAPTRDGKLVVGAAGQRGAAQVWDVATGKLLRTLAEPTRSRPVVRRLLGLSADGTMAAVDEGTTYVPRGQQTHQVGVWGVADGRPVGRFSVPGYVNTVALSADGRTAAVGSGNGYFVLFDLVTGGVRPEFTLPGRDSTRPVTPDGKRLFVLASGDGPANGAAMLHLTTFPTLPDPLPAGGDLGPDEVAEWWPALGAGNEFRRRFAIRAWAARPEQAVYEAAGRLKPDPAGRRAVVAELITVLDDDRHEVRDKAQNELAGLAHRFEPVVAAAHKAAPPGEVRNRLTSLLNAARETPPPADLLADLAAVQVLEQVKSADARKLLGLLAGGTDGSVLTVEARNAVGRLGNGLPDVKK